MHVYVMMVAHVWYDLLCSNVLLLVPIAHLYIVLHTSCTHTWQPHLHTSCTQGCEATICMPTTTPDIKVNAVKRLGGQVELVGESYQETQAYAQVGLVLCMVVLYMVVLCVVVLCMYFFVILLICWRCMHMHTQYLQSTPHYPYPNTPPLTTH